MVGGSRRYVCRAVAITGALLALLSLTPGAAGAAGERPTRYSIVHGCYSLAPASGGAVAKQGGAYVVVGDPEAFRMQATDLGRYLFYGRDGDFLALDGSAVTVAANPSDDADWTVRESGDGFTIVNEHAGRALAVGGGALVAVDAGAAERFGLVEASGCASYPEVEIGATGRPATGSPAYGEVSGLVDGHMHGMAYEFLGGRAHCGRPFHRFGAPYALVDCPDHEIGNGCAAVLENVLYGNPVRCHDPVGWPTFKDWPAYNSLTHEQSYWRWLERAWRGGLRVYVNLFVENGVLCELYPYKHNSCNEMDSVLLQAQRIREMQDYIDAQFGGPGKGFFRIVDTPYQARKVINRGKLAVIQGMEVSEPFDCGLETGFPTCDNAQIDAWLDRLQDLGVTQLEITNKFDNALTGVAGDNGTTGVITNVGNLVSTGKFFDLRECNDPEFHDHAPTAINYPHNDDMIIGNGLAALLPGGALPVYPSGPVCNTRGLSPLGEHAIRGIVERGMVFDPDHMSVIGRNQALSLVESLDYSGIVSSHSWSTDDALPRIYALGGMVMPYAGGSTDFIHQWQHLRDFYRQGGTQYFGVGYGADMNGFGAQGPPRGADVPNPVSYPFRSFDGNVELVQQRSGERVFDINTDGVAHYGLYPDWIEDLRMQAGDRIIRDMGRGAEAYLEMWERADGIEGVRCDRWRQRFLTARGIPRRLQLGDHPKLVLKRAGQPVTRTRAWRFCANGRTRAKPLEKKSSDKRVVAVFNKRGRVALIASTLRKQRAEGLRVGMPADALRKRAERLGGVWVRDAGNGRMFVYGVRKRRISFVAVASGGAAATPAALRRYLRRARVH
jgi:microsomal dipeptidase-like Zn-dependent dipeptidase